MVGALYLILAITSVVISDIVISSSNQKSSQNTNTEESVEDSLQTNTKDTLDNSNESDVEEASSSSWMSSMADSYSIFNEHEMYVASFFKKAVFEFDNLEFKNGKKLFTETDVERFSISIEDIDILYKAGTKLYFCGYSEDNETYGLYYYDLNTERVVQKIEGIYTYDFNEKPDIYFDYLIVKDNKCILNKYYYETEETENIFTIDDVNQIKGTRTSCYDNQYITCVTYENSSSIYLNNDNICNIEIPIDEFMVSNHHVCVFVNNMVYTINLNTLQIDNAKETPFETSDYHRVLFYDESLSNINKKIYYGTVMYQLNVEDCSFEKQTRDEDLVECVYNYEDKYLIMINSNYFQSPVIMEINTGRVLKIFEDIEKIKIDLQNNYYFIDEDDNIQMFSEELLNQ